MKKLKQWLGMCEHNWIDVKHNLLCHSVLNYVMYDEYIQQCSHCKKYRHFKL